MAVVLVTGASGRLGRKAVQVLAGTGHDVRAFSRGAGGDLRTGDGLDEAIEDARLVLHAASDSHDRHGAGDIEGTRRLLAASGEVEHLLYVSIVGVDRIPYRYYRNKLACERLVAASGVPFTILRGTQFHELAEGSLRHAESRALASTVPLGFKVQLVAAQEVAERLAGLLATRPAHGVVELGGPEVLTVGRVVETWRELRGPVRVVPLPLVGRVARAFRRGLNTTVRAEGRQTWREYVASLD